MPKIVWIPPALALPQLPGYCGPLPWYGQSSMCRRNTLVDAIHTTTAEIRREYRRASMQTRERYRDNLLKWCDDRRKELDRFHGWLVDHECTCPEPYAERVYDRETALPPCSC